MSNLTESLNIRKIQWYGKIIINKIYLVTTVWGKNIMFCVKTKALLRT